MFQNHQHTHTKIEMLNHPPFEENIFFRELLGGSRLERVLGVLPEIQEGEASKER